MKRWTPEEENELRELYGTMTAEALAVRFGTTYRAICQKCNKMGLKKDQPNKIHLTREQELWMRTHYPHMSTEICALILGISHSSVTRQARHLGLNKNRAVHEGMSGAHIQKSA